MTGFSKLSNRMKYYVHPTNAKFTWMAVDNHFLRAIRALWPWMLAGLNQRQWLNRKRNLKDIQLRCIIRNLAYVYRDNVHRLTN